MIVYKVCSVISGEFRSALVYKFPELNTTYAIGETSKPPIGALFAFKGMARAREYSIGSVPAVILKCKATVSPMTRFLRKTTETSVPDPKEKKGVKRFWSLLRRGSYVLASKEFPAGGLYWTCMAKSVLCSSITPLEVVE